MAATAYELLAFGLFALVTLGSSLGVVLVREVWHAALLLGVALLSVAVHFVMLHAEFLAAMQVLVYVGGVLILISFAVMLVSRGETPSDVLTTPSLNLGTHLFRGLGAVALFALLAWVALRATIAAPVGFPADANITATIGYALIGLVEFAEHETESFLAALIIVAIVLDAALDGAVMLARRETGGTTTATSRPDEDEPGAGAREAARRTDGGEDR